MLNNCLDMVWAMHYPEQYLGWMMTIDETDVTMEWHDYPNPGDSDGDGFGGGGSDGGRF